MPVECGEPDATGDADATGLAKDKGVSGGSLDETPVDGLAAADVGVDTETLFRALDAAASRIGAASISSRDSCAEEDAIG